MKKYILQLKQYHQLKNYIYSFHLYQTEIFYSPMIHQYFDYKFGPLEYRSIRFEHETHNVNNYQGNAVVNYTEYEVPYTRIIEHKHFEFDTTTEKTIISKEL